MIGVYIKDMEMPKAGRLTLQIGADGSVYVVNRCNITAETYTTEAVPVPPNGRLIDAEKLIAELKDPPLHRSLAGMCMDDVIGMINDAPTVIEAEESET